MNSGDAACENCVLRLKKGCFSDFWDDVDGACRCDDDGWKLGAV